MALTDLQKSFITTYSLQLMQQDMLTNSIFAGSPFGAALRGMVLPSAKVTTYSDPTAQALNSRLRTDARVLEQSAANLDEAVSLYGTLSKSVTSISDKLDRMLEILQDVQAGTMTSAEGKAEYDNLYIEVLDEAKAATYNGEYVLDGTKWSGSTIIEAPSVAGDPGKLYIQTSPNGEGGVTVNLYDFEAILTPTANNGWLPANISNNEWTKSAGQDLTAEIPQMQALTKRVASIEELYQSRESNLAAQADSLRDQADLLAQAAVNRSARVATSEDVFLDYILGKVGSIIDENS